MLLKKALFLDRDGIINIDYGYVHRPEKCVFVNGIKELLQTAKEKDYFIVVVTNQSGIGRGYYSEEEFHQFMLWMNDKLDNALDAIYFCPHHPVHGIGKYQKDSFNRKPNPGMILKAMKEHSINPNQSLLIGDSEKDISAATKAQLSKYILYKEEDEKTSSLSLPEATITISSLHEAIQHF